MDSSGKPDLPRYWHVALCNRWVIAIAGAVVMMTTGTLYSWGIFTQPLLVAFHWDVTATTWAYALANFCLAAIGAVVGGFWQDRVGPRYVAVTGVILWGTGNILAGLGTAAWGAPWLYLTYGIVGGVGAGMAYITPVSMVTKWFPDRRGLAGGMVAAGFGLGAFIYNQLVPRLESFHTAASHASGYRTAKTLAAAGQSFGDATRSAAAYMTPADIAAVMHVFVASGCVYLIVGLLAASLFRNPPEAISSGRCVVARQSPRGLRPTQVIRTRQFYLLWLQLFTNVIAGITIISNAIFILQDLTHLPSANSRRCSDSSACSNAAGRLLFGAPCPIASAVGRRLRRCSSSRPSYSSVSPMCTNFTLALAGFGLILLCCGGGFGVMPAYNAEYFGTRFVGLNYGLILSAWGFAGLVGPLFIARAKDLTGSFAGCCLLSRAYCYHP